MSIFGKLFSGSKAKATAIRCKPCRGFTFDAVGEAGYQNNLIRITGPKSERGAKLEVEATLLPESSNKFDPDAIMIKIKGKQVGYLAKADAPVFGAFLKENGADEATCPAKIVGGWIDDDGNKKHYGVKLKIAWPPKPGQVK